MQPFIQCLFCKHIFKEGRRCKAFPNGIPNVIWNGKHDHKKSYKGDKGIIFEPNKGE